MSLNIRRFATGIQLVGQTSTTVDGAGEIQYNSTLNKLVMYNGTSASPIVTEAHTATLTNKTFASPILTGVLSIDSGTAALPAYTFTGDLDTGFYHAAANTLGFATNGVTAGTINASAWLPTLPIQGADGSQGAPAYSFSADTDTGMWRDSSNDLRLGVGNSTKLHLSSTLVEISTTPITVPNGTAGAPTYSFITGTTSGMYYEGGSEPAFSRGGSRRFRINTNNDIEFDGRINAPDGTVSLPSLAFTNDTNTGIYSGGSDILNITTGGVSRLSINASGQTLHADGTAALPSISLASAASTGFYKDTVLGGISLSIGGTRLMNVATTYTFLLTPQVFFEDGTTSLPSIAFDNDSDTGWWRISSGRVGLSLNGVTPLDISAHSLVFGGSDTGGRNMYVENTNAGAGAHAFLLALSNGGDPYLRIANGTVERTLGIDTSDSGTFKINTTGAGPSGGTTHLSITTGGLVTIGTGTATTHRLNTQTAATASAGGSTLPLTPEGFITININGTDRKIPYYPT